MREISASATGVAKQKIDVAFTRLRAIDTYPDWYPDAAKRVEVIKRDEQGAPLEVDATLAAVAGPLRKNFDVRLEVQTEQPTLVALVRVADDRGDHEALAITWRLRELAADETEVTVEMNAHLDLPPFLPVGSVAQEVANGFLAAAIAHLA